MWHGPPLGREGTRGQASLCYHSRHYRYGVGLGVSLRPSVQAMPSYLDSGELVLDIGHLDLLVMDMLHHIGFGLP